MRQYGIGRARYIDLFMRSLPYSALALQRSFPKISRMQTFQMMAHYDNLVAKVIPPCDMFIGLSGVINRSYAVASQRYGAITVCDRGSAHVNVQERLIATEGQSSLPADYITRELSGYEMANYIAVPSSFAEKTFLSEGFSQDRLFRNFYGVELSRFPYVERHAKKRGLRAIFVGNWSYQKGCDLFEGALQRMPELELTHVGMQMDVPFPKNPRFNSLGYVPNSELSRVYAQHDVLVLPSRQDGFGMVLLEAFASGLSIVASPNTGGQDVKDLSRNKSRVQIMGEHSVEGLIAALKKIAGQNCNLSKSQVSIDLDAFTWKAYALRYEKFIRCATGND
jgi:hypothetical protein